jgi:hypothetical protein
LLVVAMVMWMRREKLYYGGRSGDASEVRGVHPEALQALAEIPDRAVSG